MRGLLDRSPPSSPLSLVGLNSPRSPAWSEPSPGLPLRGQRSNVSGDSATCFQIFSNELRPLPCELPDSYSKARGAWAWAHRAGGRGREPPHQGQGAPTPSARSAKGGSRGAPRPTRATTPPPGPAREDPPRPRESGSGRRKRPMGSRAGAAQADGQGLAASPHLHFCRPAGLRAAPAPTEGLARP